MAGCGDVLESKVLKRQGGLYIRHLVEVSRAREVITSEACVPQYRRTTTAIGVLLYAGDLAQRPLGLSK